MVEKEDSFFGKNQSPQMNPAEMVHVQLICPRNNESLVARDSPKSSSSFPAPQNKYIVWI